MKKVNSLVVKTNIKNKTVPFITMKLVVTVKLAWQILLIIWKHFVRFTVWWQVKYIYILYFHSLHMWLNLNVN